MSSSYCAAVNCNNCRKNDSSLSYFRFPKDVKRCQIWVRNCRRADLDAFFKKSPRYLYDNCRICSQHFEETQFFNFEETQFFTPLQKNRLKKDAIPTLFKVPNPPPQIAPKRRKIQRASCGDVDIVPANESDTDIGINPGLPQRMRNGLSDYFCGCLFLTEASAPFVSSKAVLSLLNLKDSRMYNVNGAVMIVVFFVCRIALFPFMYWSYSIYADITFFQVMLSIPKKCYFGCFLILSLQIYWWGVMLVGAHKVLKNATSKQSNENQGKPKLS